jgi:hypothetical protein
MQITKYGFLLFKANAAMLMRSALLWDIMWHRVVIVYRRFGTTCWFHLHGSRKKAITCKGDSIWKVHVGWQSVGVIANRVETG